MYTRRYGDEEETLIKHTFGKYKIKNIKVKKSINRYTYVTEREIHIPPDQET